MNMETFKAADDIRTRDFYKSVAMGFNLGLPTEELSKRMVQSAAATGTVLTELKAQGSPDPVLNEMPISTFARFAGTVNLGGGPRPAALITVVTVRPTSKRRGILRKMMTANLREMAREGSDLALLTASSAAIYGRFGFRDVVDWEPVKVDVSKRFELAVPFTGRVEIVSLEWLYPRLPELFEQFHSRTRGSVSRFSGYHGLELDMFDKEGKLDNRFLGAVHLDEDGAIDGYVVYRIEEDTTMHVLDCIPFNSNAELALWDFLASVEPVQQVCWKYAPAGWLLPRALKDRRAVSRDEVSDGLWARVLNPTVLASREYRTDGVFSFTVEDSLGLASGDFELRVEDGHAQVVEGSGGPLVSVPALGALLFGSESVSDLQALGLVEGVAQEDLAALDVLFSAPGRARFATPF